MEADLLVMAESAFSAVPGIMTKHKVLYSPQRNDTLAHVPAEWEIVNETILLRTATQREDMLRKC